MRDSRGGLTPGDVFWWGLVVEVLVVAGLALVN